MPLALDFETATARPGLQAPPPVCLAVASESGATLYKDDQLEAYEAALDSGELLVFLYGAYDNAVAAAAAPHLIPKIFQAYDEDRITDVGNRQKLIDIALGEYNQRRGKGYGLATLSERLCDRHMEKEDTWRLRYWDLVHLPLEEWPEDAIEYPLNDGRTTLDIFKVQEESLAEVNRLCVLADQFDQCRADFALKLMSVWGLRTDAEGVAWLREQCETEQAKLQDELLAAGLLRWQKKKGVRVITKCVRVAQQRLLDTYPAGEHPRLTDTGEKLKAKGDEAWREVRYVAADGEACSDSMDPLLESYARYARLGNLLTGHVKHMAEGIETPIHTRFEVLMETGRTSSSKPNIQNVRRAPGARECYKPRDGYCYVGCDIDKAELHTLAQCCIDLFGRSTLGDALNAGLDPHVGLGARLAGVTYDDLLAGVLAGDKEAKEWRRRAKPGNFGFPGGMGPAGMVRYAKSTYNVLFTLDEATELKGRWAEEYPVEANEYLGWIRQLTQAEGHATIEHFVSHRWRGRVPYCTAANSFFQGWSADAMKAALWAVIRKCFNPGTALFGCRPVNLVHDEIIMEAPLSTFSGAAWEMQRTMVEAYNRYVPDVPTNGTPVAMDRWSKSAETIVDDNGNLEIWRYQRAT